MDLMYPDPVPLGTDGIDYHVLVDAARRVKSIPGIICEIGVRTGGSTKIIIDEINRGRTYIGIDPYGGLPYDFDGDGGTFFKTFTNEEYRNPSLPIIYQYAFDAGVNFLFFNMTSQQFMTRFNDGVPIYDKTETIMNKYALVFFDGLHRFETVMAETMFFSARSTNGTMFVFDDCETYNHDLIDQYLIEQSWSKIMDTGRKMSYIKKDPFYGVNE